MSIYSKMYPSTKTNEIKKVVKEINTEPKKVLTRIEYENLLGTEIDNLREEMKNLNVVEILNTVIQFGKYKGERYKSLPSSYYEWLLEKGIIKDKNIIIAFKMINKLEEFEKQLNYSLSKDF